jgi:hypothetical protein
MSTGRAARLLPQAQLAVLPAIAHITLTVGHAEWLLTMIGAFLDAPMPGGR